MDTHSETILLVDDDLAVVDGTVRVLEQEGFPPVRRAADGRSALSLIDSSSCVVLLDLGLPDLSGEEVLARVKQEYPAVPVVIVTALADVDTAVRCMSAGAYDYVVKGSDPARLFTTLRRAIESRRKALEIEALRERMQAAEVKHPRAFEAIITGNERMKSLFRFIEAVAASDEPLLLQGETGTGKELFAQAVHLSSGSKGPFVATNLGGLDDFMVSDTLFGHVRGAYTGADETRKGLVATAAGGTLFLDEIGELSPTTQVKLLRFLENREYFPLGSDVSRKSDARVVAATNRDLEALAGQGGFRKDLLYRLSTYRVDIPPLRQRKDDLPLLCRHLLKAELDEASLAVLAGYAFPGNVRELRGLLLRARLGAAGGQVDPRILEQLISGGGAAPAPPVPDLPPRTPVALPTIRRAVSDLIREALKRTEGHQQRAARILGISPQALNKRLKRKDEGHL